MLQRIQSVYLFIASIILVCCMFISIGYFSSDMGVTQLPFEMLGVQSGDSTVYATWGLFVLILIGVILSLVTIFLFKNRPLQIRISIFNLIILVGYYATLIFFIFKIKTDMSASFYMKWTICLPAVALILLFLAIRSIGKDEVLVRASDRIR